MGTNMRKFIVMFLLLLAGFCFGQQINHTYGTTTAGGAYTSSGASIDSGTTVTVILDLQDYFYTDFNPTVYDSVTALANSDAFFLGTLWFYLNADSTNDSTNLNIDVYPAGFTYDDNDGNRIEAAEYTVSTTAVVLRDSSTTRTLGDILWSAVNIYLNASTRFLPPEIIQLKFAIFDPAGSGGTEMSGGFIHWDFVYTAVYESQQNQRSTTRTQNSAKKPLPSLK